MHYKFNDCGVCINPKVIFDFEDKKFNAKIKIFELDGKWDYGYQINTSNPGEGKPCCNPEFMDENTCMAEALKDMFEKVMGYTKQGYVELRTALKVCEALENILKPNTKFIQQSFF